MPPNLQASHLYVSTSHGSILKVFFFHIEVGQWNTSNPDWLTIRIYSVCLIYFHLLFLLSVGLFFFSCGLWNLQWIYSVFIGHLKSWLHFSGLFPVFQYIFLGFSFFWSNHSSCPLVQLDYTTDFLLCAFPVGVVFKWLSRVVTTDRIIWHKHLFLFWISFVLFFLKSF